MGFRSAVLGLVTALLPVYLQAEDSLPKMFNNNGAINLFTGKVEVAPQREPVLLRPKLELPRVEEKKVAEKDFKHSNELPVQDNLSQAEESELSNYEKLVREFGEPNEPHQVNAQSNAPKPMQAAIKALALGERELAVQYARQYVRYQRDLQNTISDWVGIQGVLMQDEGMLAPTSWSSDSKYDEIRQIVAKLKAEEAETDSQDPGEKSYSTKVDLVLKDQIAKSEETKHDVFTTVANSLDSTTLELDEKTERARARKELEGKVPVARDGVVQVMYFFRPHDRTALALGSDIERLYQSTKQNTTAKFSGYSIDELAYNDLVTYRSSTGVTFDVLNGYGLAKKLKIESSPTFVYYVPTQGTAHFETGIRNFYFLDELLRIMQGKRV